ncbi:succinate-coa ligase [Micromonas commoda]|uniref:Succinate--CoA ligase [ADP-forming] subunit beta, mitochondrial n=1 Tax=Micromonas commoda (strain RCC299 / NOUM17 / CCMP2709) TaxID=296587 RepID=C1FDY7_MICCC|nr:succinate-coa ligase [Micromonas commoda]ACO68473.1 succinate-coa ligase [Micromonas commoda]|eukprot:XP_002507215.1 succinate-coa ligase [Micromonas commoda]
MFRIAFRAACHRYSPATFLFGAAVRLQNRQLNIHEYQGAEILARHGVRVPLGIACQTADQVHAAAEKLRSDDGDVVLKSQILAGGRGLGHFKNGLQGGVHIVPSGKAQAVGEKMLGQLLVTKQTGAAGKPVNTVLVAQKMKLVNEMYFAILLDRASAGPLVIACSEGGTSIEDLAETHPEKITRMKIDIRTGLTEAQARDIVAHLGVKGSVSDAVAQVKALYNVFISSDCTMLEINPLAETAEAKLIAADAKLNFDDNAEYRQKGLFALRDHSQEDPREVTAGKFDLNYIGLDGNIGCMVNGAGLAMATMDIISLHGAAPANFLDVGGNASEQQVVEAFKILTSDTKVQALLVNIFGGIMKCDVIASGIVSAAKQVGLQVPLVVRLEGTNVEAGKEILEKSGMDIIAANDLDDAAKKAVSALS